MPRAIFVNLSCEDLKRSKAFFEALGFSFNPQFTNDDAACLIISDCDVSFGDTDNPRLALAATELLHEFLEASEVSPAEVKKASGWDPTGHELLELWRALEEWQEGIARW